jgi:hypothetical protein
VHKRCCQTGHCQYNRRVDQCALQLCSSQVDTCQLQLCCSQVDPCQLQLCCSQVDSCQLQLWSSQVDRCQLQLCSSQVDTCALQLCSSQSSTMQPTASREWAHVAAGTCINIAVCTEHTVGTGSSPTRPRNRFCMSHKRDSSLQGCYVGSQVKSTFRTMVAPSSSGSSGPDPGDGTAKRRNVATHRLKAPHNT